MASDGSVLKMVAQNSPSNIPKGFKKGYNGWGAWQNVEHLIHNRERKRVEERTCETEWHGVEIIRLRSEIGHLPLTRAWGAASRLPPVHTAAKSYYREAEKN